MTVIIGVDPHKATHTAVAIDGDERPIARLQVVADRSPDAAAVGVGGAAGRRADVGGRVRRRAGQAAGPAAPRPPASTSSMCRRRWRRGCGCWARRRRRRTTPTTRWPPPSPGCGTAGCGRCASRTTPRCSGCWSTATTTWLALRTQAACRLHVALRELVAGGAPRRLSGRSGRQAAALRPPGRRRRGRTQASRRRAAGRRPPSRPRHRRRSRPGRRRRRRVGHVAARAARCRPDRRRVHPRPRR